MAKWTKGEITTLTKNYGKKTVVQIATLVGRSEAAVGMYLAKHRSAFPHIRAWAAKKCAPSGLGRKKGKPTPTKKASTSKTRKVTSTITSSPTL